MHFLNGFMRVGRSVPHSHAKHRQPLACIFLIYWQQFIFYGSAAWTTPACPEINHHILSFAHIIRQLFRLARFCANSKIRELFPHGSQFLLLCITLGLIHTFQCLIAIGQFCQQRIYFCYTEVVRHQIVVKCPWTYAIVLVALIQLLKIAAFFFINGGRLGIKLIFIDSTFVKLLLQCAIFRLYFCQFFVTLVKLLIEFSASCLAVGPYN